MVLGGRSSALFSLGRIGSRLSKGKQVNIPAPKCRYNYGNVNELRDVCRSPGKSSLFFLTVFQTKLKCVMALESDCLEKGLEGWESIDISSVSGALRTALENRRERVILTFGRTHNRIRSPRWKASSR